jgi:hypothetical protein
VVKHFDTADVRVGVGEVLVVAADAELVTHHLLKLGAHLAAALARLHVQNIERRSCLETGGMRDKKGAVAMYSLLHQVKQLPFDSRRGSLPRQGKNSFPVP